jgi:hypothetical protein
MYLLMVRYAYAVETGGKKLIEPHIPYYIPELIVNTTPTITKNLKIVVCFLCNRLVEKVTLVHTIRSELTQ